MPPGSHYRLPGQAIEPPRPAPATKGLAIGANYAMALAAMVAFFVVMLLIGIGLMLVFTPTRYRTISSPAWRGNLTRLHLVEPIDRPTSQSG